MRRLLAMFNEIRNSVRNSNKVGKTENCTGRRMYNADNSTTTPNVTLVARKRSRINAGTGTSMTNTVATAASGISHSAVLPFAWFTSSLIVPFRSVYRAPAVDLVPLPHFLFRHSQRSLETLPLQHVVHTGPH